MVFGLLDLKKRRTVRILSPVSAVCGKFSDTYLEVHKYTSFSSMDNYLNNAGKSYITPWFLCFICVLSRDDMGAGLCDNLSRNSVFGRCCIYIQKKCRQMYAYILMSSSGICLHFFYQAQSVPLFHSHFHVRMWKCEWFRISKL